MFTEDLGFTLHDVIIFAKLNPPFIRINGYTRVHEFVFILVKGLGCQPKTFNPLKVRTRQTGPGKARSGLGKDGKAKKIANITYRPTTNRTNIWAYLVGHAMTRDRYAYNHPAMFPEQLAEDLILSWSDPGDLILDPMCGSGTTLKMAARHSRRYLGIDISAEYAEMAAKRVLTEAAQEKLF